MIVSGLPTRNGFNHIKVIVDMSLDFMDYVSKFRISHLPNDRVELRIGINSGIFKIGEKTTKNEAYFRPVRIGCSGFIDAEILSFW